MIGMALVSWWYGVGWSGLARNVRARVASALLFFSVGLLLKTLFDPFRQIDAGNVRGSLEVQLRAWFDRSFSRFVGFFVRMTVVVFGLVVAAMIGLIGVVQMLVWPLLPVLPLVGLALALWELAP
jgi:hypothetical protein